MVKASRLDSLHQRRSGSRKQTHLEGADQTLLLYSYSTHADADIKFTTVFNNVMFNITLPVLNMARGIFPKHQYDIQLNYNILGKTM